MCGICGILERSGDGGEARERTLREMCDSMIHRGPDDEGLFFDGPFGMGMRRLSIIDLLSGHQPILNETGRLAIVCNGEIYNYPELRTELQAKGHTFATKSDTETALHLYEECGVEMVHRLNGMYAIAIWDSDRKSLLLIRDRLGIKPLYYRDGPDRLVFASELKCLLADGRMPADLDPQAVHDYLSLNYIPAPRTIYRCARKLPAGHYLRCAGGKTEVKQYWDLTYSGIEPNGHRHPDEWYAERLSEKIDAAVKRHLLSDVPLGVLNSGGIDSSTVVATASRITGGLSTFSIGFEEASYNELEFARMVSERFGATHHEEILRPNAAEILPKLAWHLDEPFADHSAIPTYCVSRMARGGVTVALSGDGGDEMFAGYETYPAHIYARILRALPTPLVESVVKPVAGKLPVADTKVSLDYRIKRLLSGYNLSTPEAHLCWRRIFSETEKRKLYAPGYFEANDIEPTAAMFDRYYRSAPAVHELDRILYLDAKTYMVDSILNKVDKMSMAVSLETRVPLLDHDLVEFVTRLPPGLKLRGLVKKYVLKKAMKGIIPSRIMRRRKAGFSLPINKWIKGDLKEMVADLLAPANIGRTGLLDARYVQQVLDNHIAGKRDNSRAIWGLTNLMLWYNTFERDRLSA